MDNSDLGNRQKFYEGLTDTHLMPLVPVMVRLDGRCFSRFTKDLERPYDKRFSDLMIETARFLVKETNARISYTQSDEISLVLLNERFDSELFMGGRSFKMISIMSAITTAFFNRNLPKYLPEKIDGMPVFDCRVWNVPSKTEAVNALIFREQDATRNSISMAAQSQFSHNQLMNKSCDQMQEMLFQEKGINWNDYPSFFKRGTYVQKYKIERPFTAEEIEKLPSKHNARNDPDLKVMRSEIRVIELPIMTKIINREEVVFDGAEPIVKVE